MNLVTCKPYFQYAVTINQVLTFYRVAFCYLFLVLFLLFFFILFVFFCFKELFGIIKMPQKVEKGSIFSPLSKSYLSLLYTI